MTISEHAVNGTKIENVGFDWLTVTAVEGDYKHDLWSAGVSIKTEMRIIEHVPKDWSAMGYDGWMCGPAKYGERGENEAILILSGPESQIYAFLPDVRSERVTRADLQVTIRFDPPDSMVASKTHKLLERKHSNAGRKPFLNLLQDATGDTLYVGKRNAGVSLRFYDKSWQMGEDNLGSCWRYEVQYRREAAKKAHQRIAVADRPNHAAIGLVGAEFEKRGIQTQFGSGQEVTAIEIGRTVTTVDGQLAWLEKCVAPVVSQLCALGYDSAVINALSLRGIMNNIKDGV